MTSAKLAAADLSDDDFLAAFEAGRLDVKGFDHKAHVRLGWIYITRMPLADAINRFTRGLKRWVTALGAEGKYHETVTWAYLMLIHDRQTARPEASFDAFLAENADLLGTPSPLEALYHRETLASDRARKSFVLPDKLAS
ncbi:hypothetical protein [Kordiimonas marina]|uniref:hypothetical protein n=1 Tax=Kordiimonas marina TaxID=2872312 RepID=UPI001FF67A4C|nr:hypothetical protein [Kordiimonas marina]MCJ9430001.1 hypothetical protein [Kordiimonas marina]